MFALNDKSYYQDREMEARARADAAADPAIRAIHLDMAARYHGMALAAEFEHEEPRQLITG
jgi:hypothetical protein